MNLVLIGFMGTGKSKIGRMLARELNFDFIDTDQAIELEQQNTINSIFKEKGEAFFRELEHKLAEELSKLDSKVIATGGGWVLNPDNVQLLQSNGFIIALTARPEKIYERVKTENHRPLLACENPLKKITALLQEREGLYRKADLFIDTSDETPNELSKKIIKELVRRGLLNERG